MRAFELAGITYRQLDYWARRGWVTPSIEPATGRASRRLYSAEDILRLAALGHFGRSGVDVGELGPRMARLDLPAQGDWLVVAGPEAELAVVPGEGLRSHVAAPGAFVVFDPAEVRSHLGVDFCQPVATSQAKVRSA